MRDLQYSNAHLPADVLQVIGHVTALWAKAEILVDEAVYRAIERSRAAGEDVPWPAQFRQRCALLLKLFRRLPELGRFEHLARDVVEQVHALRRERNLVVHGAALALHNDDGPPRYLFRRIAWETPLRLRDKKEMTVEDVGDLADKISDLVGTASFLDLPFWEPAQTSDDKSG